MEVVYTDHAKQRMAKRKISAAMVEETLGKPQAIAAGTENKKIAFKEFKGGIVEVVFAEEGSKKVVISVRWS